MPQVAVVINDKTYRMACDEGQEEHLLDLAKRFDSYVSHLKDSFGEIGDQRLTVMAGVMITDELVEAQRKLRDVKADLADLRREQEEASKLKSGRESELAKSLAVAAEKMEKLGAKLISS